MSMKWQVPAGKAYVPFYPLFTNSVIFSLKVSFQGLEDIRET